MKSKNKDRSPYPGQPLQQKYFLRQDRPSFSHLRARQRHEDIQNHPSNVHIHCGWGRLLIGHTFESEVQLAKSLLQEKPGERDIAMYIANPHVVLNYAPQMLFLDPSDTFRLWLNEYRQKRTSIPGVLVRRAANRRDVDAINRIYKTRQMVPLNVNHVLEQRHSKQLIYLIAEEMHNRKYLGTVMGVHHEKVFNDPDKGASLWCLAVEPDCKIDGVGEALTRYVIEYFQARGCQYIDLSVMHNNQAAKKLYKKLKFKPLNTFTIKTKSAINEKLFIGPQPCLNPYAQIIVDEALSRGIDATVEDEDHNIFTLSLGGRQIRCFESLSEMTPAVSVILCQNKLLTHRTLFKAKLSVPAFSLYQNIEQASTFLQKHSSLVVKPIDSEQGRGISVDIKDPGTLQLAIKHAQKVSADVLLESYHEGQDLRVLVIGQEVIAAAIRQPASIVGDGINDIKTLIEKQSRRRQIATDGESCIPVDEETERCIYAAGYTWNTILKIHQHLFVRKTANLHTGGILIDVTDELHPELGEAALKAARALNIPVTGIDMIVQSAKRSNYVIIEANERPGLANHEPHPTAQRFIDLLFPTSEKILR